MPTNETLKRQGEIFHQIRRQRNYPIAYLGEKSTLSRFERGVGHLQLDAAVDIFERAHFSISDWSVILNDNELSQTKQNFSAIIDAFIRQDSTDLLKLQMDSQNAGDALISQGIKVLLTDSILSADLKAHETETPTFSEKEQGILSDYIFKVNYWDCYNLYLLGLYGPILTPKMISYCFEHFVSHAEKYKRLPEHNQILQFAMNHILFSLIEKGEKNAASDLFEQAVLLTPENDLFNKVLRRYLHGYFDYTFGKTADGKKEMQSALSTLSDYGAAHFEKLFNYHYETLFN